MGTAIEPQGTQNHEKPYKRTSTKYEQKQHCNKRDGRQVGERKNQPRINPKTMKNHGKLGLGPSRVLPGEARGPVWPQGGPGLEKGTKKPRNTIPFLAPKWKPGPTFRGVFLICLNVFWGARVAVFLCFLVPEDFIFTSILALL